MRRTKKIDLEGIVITVREMTLAELRDWLKSLDDLKADLITDGLFEGISLRDLVRMSDLDVEIMDTLLPSDLERLLAVCRELNPHFFNLRSRLRVALQSAATTIPA